MGKMYRSKDWLYNEYVIKNKTQKEIANLCSLNSDSTIGNYIKKFNIKEDAIKTRLLAELEYFKKGFEPNRHLFKQYGLGDNNE